ncbi:MAG: hypothetical protein B6244_06535 [Candidatus Cloacimonetes bacterium 4572_55]|nr:MAG: hypothetical protein B6244_06535 [Candidatus Cloacimonetes bacterium 4572_55]
MSEPLSLVALFFSGLFVGFVNVMAGGGSALTLPLLILIGLDTPTANGTNRISILLLNMSGFFSFYQQKVSKFRQGILMALCTLPGAIIGALAAIRMEDALFRRVLAFVIIGIMLTVIFPRSKSTGGIGDKKPKYAWLIYPIMFGVGFYGGFIQAGVGFLLMACMVNILGIDLVRVNMYKTLIILIYTIPVLGIFILTGCVNWKYGLIMAAGSASGAWISARLAVKKGEKAVRIVFVIMILVIAVKLLGGF